MNVQKILEERKQKGLYRTLVETPKGGGKFIQNNEQWINFSSNDYLNLSHNPTIKASAIDAIELYGTGATGSRLLGGHRPLHRTLESVLAKWLDREDSLVFGSGYLTNLGVLTAVIEPHHRVLCDRLVHASIIDGIRFGSGQWKRFPHNDMNRLETLLARPNPTSPTATWIVTESVFSMDGDIAPLQDIAFLARKYGAMLFVDEAHALGVFGSQGNGLCAQLGIEPDIITGTLSKALGSYGGFVACSHSWREYFINMSREFIYSTALPPASTQAAIAAIEYIQKNPSMGSELLNRARTFYTSLIQQVKLKNERPFYSQIVPVILGKHTTDVCIQLKEKHIYVTPIRSPTVPKGTERIRFSITLAHTREDLHRVSSVLHEVLEGM